MRRYRGFCVGSMLSSVCLLSFVWYLSCVQCCVLWKIRMCKSCLLVLLICSWLGVFVLLFAFFLCASFFFLFGCSGVVLCLSALGWVVLWRWI